MNPVRIIRRKRDGEELAAAEIEFFVQGYAGGTIPDYQMSALAMAIFWRGMSVAETAELTRQMILSGRPLRFDDGRAVVDKHSTGGIGDKVSLILAPLLAACHLRVPMISGRGLGATGGTLDKLESISGFRTNLDARRIKDVIGAVGCVITGATAEIAPADKKLYGLRDVTATVASIPLITASIMSKKLSEGLDALVLDVKCGDGAFMKTLDQAEALAKSLTATGQAMGVATAAVITDMNQPLGAAAGNAVEVHEALDVLQGRGPPDVRALTLNLGAELLVMCAITDTHEQAERQLAEKLDNGAAYEVFQQMVHAQGGSLDVPPRRAAAHVLESSRAGYVSGVATEELGWALIEMGAGRQQMTDNIDHAVGVELSARIGDKVTVGQPLMTAYVDDLTPQLRDRLLATFQFSSLQPQTPSLVWKRLGDG